jgi:tRNA threonylcarbamoyladenosine biosynthesis protein TsaB
MSARPYQNNILKLLMILYFDTTDFHGVRLALINPSSKLLPKEQVIALAYNENYKTLAYLKTFLKKHKVQPKNLLKIIVCSGPGSFNGIRVGVSIAQALGFALNIPVVAIKKSQTPKDLRKLPAIKSRKHITLHYGAKPNITKPKTTPPSGSATARKTKSPQTKRR